MNTLYNFSFPKNIAEIECNEDEMRVKIEKAIEYYLSLRNPMYPPQMAFEYIIKEELKPLKDPIRKCVDSVVDILSGGIERCIQRVRVFELKSLNKCQFANPLILDYFRFQSTHNYDRKSEKRSCPIFA